MDKKRKVIITGIAKEVQNILNIYSVNYELKINTNSVEYPSIEIYLNGIRFHILNEIHNRLENTRFRIDLIDLSIKPGKLTIIIL